MVSTQSSSSWFASCPRGVERLLVKELQQLGASDTKEAIAGVSFKGSQSVKRGKLARHFMLLSELFSLKHTKISFAGQRPLLFCHSREGGDPDGDTVAT